jgi:NAD(P)-dependent dehydrogenase (short-subunit alcohol dehydrogenase family)
VFAGTTTSGAAARTSFAGKTALITGAASGIGREIARQLAAVGARVTVSDLPGPALERAAVELGVPAIPIDVSSRDEIAAGIDAVVGEHGRLDLMFNNAGVAIFGEYDVVTLDDWDRIIDVNLRGVAHGSTLAYRQMVRQGGGRIVNTASVAGLVPVPLQAHYCATKHAVVGLSRTLAVEAAEHGVGVTVFCPAFVETGMFTNNTIRGSLAGADPRRLVPVRPLPAATAVARLLDGIDRGRELVITPFYGRAGWWLERLAPAAAMRLHRLTLRETRRRAATLR